MKVLEHWATRGVSFAFVLGLPQVIILGLFRSIKVRRSACVIRIRSSSVLHVQAAPTEATWQPKFKPKKPEMMTHTPTANFETDLAMEFLRVVEEAAIASAKTMGQGDRKHADEVGNRGHAQRHGFGADGWHHRHRRGRARRSPHAVHRREGRQTGRRQLSRGRHRGRSAGGHQPVRHRISGRHHGAGGVGERRAAARSRLLHGEDRRRPIVQGSGRSRSSGRRTTCTSSPRCWIAMWKTW